MGFDINKFQKQYKAMAADNRGLKERLAQVEQEKAHAVAIAVITARKPLEEEIDRLRQHHVRKDRLMIEGSAVLETTTAQLAARDAQLAESQDFVHKLEARNRELVRKVNTADAPLRAEQAKVRELQSLLDGVRDRMRRKDLEKEQAVLNRQVLAGVVPDVNRRG